MAGLLVFKLIAVVLTCMVVAAPHAEAAVTCGTVYSKMSSCINYLRSGGPVPASCCAGVKSLKAAAKTTADRQSVCNCFKTFAASAPGTNPGPAIALPGKCGVSVGYPISAKVDCSKVQ